MNAIPLSRAHRGALFLLALFPASLGAYVPGFAAAPALVFVVRLVAQTLRGLAWDDATD